MEEKKNESARLRETIRREEESIRASQTTAAAARDIIDRHGFSLSHKTVTSAIREMLGNKGKRKYEPGQVDGAVADYCGRMPEANATEIAAAMLDGLEWLSYSKMHLSQIILAWRKKNLSERVIEIEPEGKRTYEVIDGSYRWKSARGPMSITVEDADRMFYEYSRHGLDLSQSQMRQKHSLKVWEWCSIKRALFLYKDANIMSPWTEDNTKPEDFEHAVDEAMRAKARDRQAIIEKSYEKELLKHYKKTVEKDVMGTFALEKMAEHLDEIMKNWQPGSPGKAQPKSSPAKESQKTKKTLVAVLADLHVGAKSENLKLTPDCSAETLDRRLAEIASRINEENADEVVVMLLGDLIESFTGLNHPNSWQSVEHGMTGANAIFQAMKSLETFLSKTNNVTKLLGISGNHDRATSSNKEDTQGQIADIIFYMLRRLYAGKIEVKHDSLVLAETIDGIRYVISHGDKKTIRDGRQAVIDHGDPSLFNVILSGHLHSRKTDDDQKSHRKITSPAVFTGNRYSEENAWHARPGFLTFRNPGTGLPVMTDHTL